MKKSRAKHFTQEEMEILSANPCVRYVSENKVMWTLEYRTEMYDRWIQNPSNSTIREVMREHHIDPGILGTIIIFGITKAFRKNGRPSNGGEKELYAITHFRTNEADDQYLISTGKFCRSNKGITFTDGFAKELYSEYPKQSIEDGLRKANIDPQTVGYQRIYRLKRLFDGGTSKQVERKRIYSDEEIQKYKDHPYVKRITHKQFSLSDAFFNEAQPIVDLSLKEVLEAFEIEPSLLSFSSFQNLQYKLRNWQKTEEEIHECSDQILRIHWNILKLEEKKVDKSLDELKNEIPSFSKQEKKNLFVMIHDLPKDPGGIYTIHFILQKIGVSRSCYYAALKNDRYGLYEQQKEAQDEEDKKLIEAVIAYRGYPKGKRTVYMMMKKLTGKQFGLNKIMRLSRKYHLQCQVRRSNNSRKRAQELLKRNRKPNLLKRTFRMHKPDEVLLTDVTYIPYGNGNLVYGSACKDPVTGVLKAFNGSNSNDLNLVETSLKEINKFPMAEHPLFHSDQGALYLTDGFQKEVSDLGFDQSMSKRGNCWDNAPQESFFGHFKDEVDLSECTCDEDVFRKMADYQDYYNNERPQWNRNKMTPVEYAEYMKKMTDDEYQSYLDRETIKYNRMKERAAAEAVARANTLGV